MTLLIGFIFCLLLGVGALTALALLRTSPPAQPEPARLGAFAFDHLTPQYALRQLAGDPAAALANQALQAGELDLAAAIALYTVELDDPTRLHILLQAGRRALTTGRNDEAIYAYHLARSVAVTAPALSFTERSQALLQIADGLADLGELAAAQDAAVQALRLAEQLPDLLPAQRIQVADTLLRLNDEIDDPALRGQVNALQRNPYLTPAGVLLVPARHTLAADIEPDPDVVAAIARRQEAAAALAIRIQHTGGIDYEPERAALAVALADEDRLRSLAFQRALSAALTPGQQFTLLDQRRAWTALRLRIAYGAFGIDLMPEWSAGRDALQQEYAAVANNMVAIAEALGAAGGDAVAQTMLRVEMQLWLAQQAEFGLYVDRPLSDIDERLHFFQGELAQLGQPLSVPVAFDAQAQPPGFRFVPFNSVP